MNGAMSNISMGRNRSNSQSADADTAGAGQNTDNFNCILLDEMSRRLGSTRKRSSGSHPSERMDSPNRKRMRLWRDRDDDDPIY